MTSGTQTVTLELLNPSLDTWDINNKMAEAAFRPPQFKEDESNASPTWKDFKGEMSSYFTAAEFADEKECPEKCKVAIRLYAMGQRYWRVYDNVADLSATDKEKYDSMVKAFDKYFEPKKVRKTVHENI